MTAIPRYEVLALRFASLPGRLRAENFTNEVDRPDDIMPLEYFVWVLRSADRVVVVDTGFSRDVAVRRGRELLTDVGDVVRLAGFDPDALADVVITHAHYDHLGSVPTFPAATIHMQAAELAFAREPGPEQSPTLEPSDVAALETAIAQGRVRQWDGDGELYPGITLHAVAGHTPGLQVVRVHTAQGWAVLASDSVHFTENRTTRNPFPIFDNLLEVIAAYERCEELADADHLILPGHDPATLARPRWRGHDDVYVLA